MQLSEALAKRCKKEKINLTCAERKDTHRRNNIIDAKKLRSRKKIVFVHIGHYYMDRFSVSADVVMSIATMVCRNRELICRLWSSNDVIP